MGREIEFLESEKANEDTVSDGDPNSEICQRGDMSLTGAKRNDQSSIKRKFVAPLKKGGDSTARRDKKHFKKGVFRPDSAKRGPVGCCVRITPAGISTGTVRSNNGK